MRVQHRELETRRLRDDADGTPSATYQRMKLPNAFIQANSVNVATTCPSGQLLLSIAIDGTIFAE
jgi:hypothetical protein